MTGNTKNIIGSVSGAGAGTGLIYFSPGGTAAPVGAAGTAGVQTITVTGVPTGGYVPILWNGQFTQIPFNGTSSALQTALQALAGGASFTVTGGPGPSTAWVVNSPAAMIQSAISTAGATATLTGGTAPNAAVVQTTAGIQTTNPGTATLGAQWKDGGIMDTTGIDIKYGETTAEIDGFGLSSAALVLFTKELITFDVAFLEVNHTSLEIYHRLPLGTTGVADASGYISGVVDGPPIQISYAAIAYIIGANGRHVSYFPNVQNTSKGDLNIPIAAAVKRPVTMTAFPDASNNTAYHYPIVPALAGL